MFKQVIKILLSIVIGVYLLKFGYIFKNDYLSIITQILGYVVISYPFILFFKVFVNQIKFDIERRRKEKEFESINGAVYGNITVKGKPLSMVKCVVRNSDGSDNENTFKWVVYSDNKGDYRLSHIPNGKYLVNFSKLFFSGSSMNENFLFEIKDQNQVRVDFQIG